ncbi:hypothetical protein GPECTOR_35g885 [Gonium pectorale]|uniref:Uncharacterized protein n=1 Tax=Gonium pectorale TaxID=33097 RepID=A0A150GC69_GONPE|nr:hypothetical protein GPECTOR_35g885 [Gonium pectorale]|eukprot:KXZ47447.1 hypothetical protein GPECTOR_35g885 [Gonium pectorale]
MAQQTRLVETPARGHWSLRVWPRLLPELAERIVGFLDRHEIAATFRHVNKATAEQFSGPLHTTIHLSEPVPPHAFAAHWLAPGATRDLTLERRKELVRLVAASGVLPNLEVALRAAALVGVVAEAFKAAAAASPTPDWTAKIEWLEAQGCRSTSMAAVAAAGMPNDAEALARLTWLQGRGYPIGDQAVEAAARAGNMSALAHLLSEVPVADEEGSAEAVSGATEGGHLEALQALQAAGWPIDFPCFATAAAEAGHLHVLAWMLEAEPVALDEMLFGDAAQPGPPGTVFLASALGVSACWTASRPMLRWLLQEGCPVDYKVVEERLANWHSLHSPQVVEVLGLLREHLGPRQPA